jgi:hypothetical protein
MPTKMLATPEKVSGILLFDALLVVVDVRCGESGRGAIAGDVGAELTAVVIEAVSGMLGPRVQHELVV